MEFFEKLGKKASETFNSAAEKTNKIANDTKLKLKINDCKGKIDDIYKEIGKKVYEKYVLDGNFDIKDQLEEDLAKISEIAGQIEEFEKQRLELCDMKQCINCKNKIEKNAKFCPECGAEQPEEPVHEAEVVTENNAEASEAFEDTVNAEPASEENSAEDVSADVEEVANENDNENKE